MSHPTWFIDTYGVKKIDAIAEEHNLNEASCIVPTCSVGSAVESEGWGKAPAFLHMFPQGKLVEDGGETKAVFGHIKRMSQVGTCVCCFRMGTLDVDCTSCESRYSCGAMVTSLDLEKGVYLNPQKIAKALHDSEDWNTIDDRAGYMRIPGICLVELKLVNVVDVYCGLRGIENASMCDDEIDKITTTLYEALDANYPKMLVEAMLRRRIAGPQRNVSMALNRVVEQNESMRPFLMGTD